MLKKRLDDIYRRYNRRDYVAPDPLQFLYDYPGIGEREIAGLVAALLAYGRVAQILKAVSRVLEILGPSPRDYLLSRDEGDIIRDFKDFKYRFTTGAHLSTLLLGVRDVLNRFGSLEACFLQGYSPDHVTVIPALSVFIKEISARGETGILAADPDRKSACKRNNLFLRWMVRQDRIDPGGWEKIPGSALVVPLDTHMFRVGVLLGFTRRKQANLATALEITRGFRQLSPLDPVRYDFCLTRFGIREEMSPGDLEILLEKS
ncbi:MAG: TIGR02757 family protein [Desulfobacteraceae bacterium]|nr:TIGR02757 family protein [Desulfobacteraceae bacterium]